jgi:DNA-binding MarR family transcriptional regulator
MTAKTTKNTSRGKLPQKKPAPARPGHREITQLVPLYDVGGQAYFGYRVVLAARLFDRRIIEILEETGQLTLPQWRVVAQLGLTGRGTVRSLADGAAVDRAEVSRAIQELIKRSFVQRTENAADKRSPTFALTDAGHKSFTAVRKPIGKFILQLVDGLTPKEIEAADKVLWAITSGCLKRE